ncbi:MAG: M18 family aminopeptidase [Lachnospiraceae bacterium]|nr:M18 family aminopeptidase [Lachnospiraceae bacterium]
MKKQKSGESCAAAQALAAFIEKSPSRFHAVENVAKELAESGCEELSERKSWKIKKGGAYFVRRNSSSLIAFRIPKKKPDGFHIYAAHSDSPTFQIKPSPEMTSEGIVRLNIEGYGGMIRDTWFDRPLSVAGRVFLDTPEGPVQRLVYPDRDLLLIPSLAIHMSRDSENTGKRSIQKEMLPFFTQKEGETLTELIAKELKVKPEEILSADLTLVTREKASFWGAEGEFFSAPRLDDLACCYGGLKGFLRAGEADNAGISVLCIFDNEEVGSRTKQGAESTFLPDVLSRLRESLSMSSEDFLRLVASGFLLSADNAHAAHPNYTEKADPKMRPRLNAGIVLKYSANQKYTTDAASAAVFKLLCKKAGVPLQEFVNHADTPGGSTLGNIANTQLSIATADIGLAQLAMHSAYETAGTKDPADLEQLAEAFFREKLPQAVL